MELWVELPALVPAWVEARSPFNPPSMSFLCRVPLPNTQHPQPTEWVSLEHQVRLVLARAQAQGMGEVERHVDQLP